MDYKTPNNKIVVTDKDITDLMVTALEGGIGYWACLDNSTKEFKNYYNSNKDLATSEITARILMDGNKVTLIDEENNNKEHTLTLKSLFKGIDKALVHRFVKLDENNRMDLCYMDALDADAVIQYAVFGEVIYG